MNSQFLYGITKHLCFILILAAVPCAKATTLGVSLAGNVYRIDEFNGATTYVSSSGYLYLNALAANNTGTIYSTSYVQYNVSKLITINPENGKGTEIATVNNTLNTIRGLAFSPTNQLYATIDTGSEYSVGPDGIFIIDVNTGHLTNIGLTGYSGIQGLAFSSDGILYGWDVDFGLLKIDSSTGIATDVNPYAGGTGDIQTLDFAMNGSLYGTCKKMYTINPATGLFSSVGSTNIDIRGIVVNPVPEPCGLVLLSLGGLVLRGRKK